MKTYTIDTDHPTNGPWRETPWGNRYAEAVLPDGRRFHVSVEKDKPVRIPYKPRGFNRGWTYVGSVRDTDGRYVASDKVSGSIGVKGLLKMAGLLP